MAGQAYRFLIVAGEASGDLHGSALVRELKRRHPESSFFGLAGERMKAEGVESTFDSSEIAIVGFTAIPRILPRAHRIFHHLLDLAATRSPTGAILIDSPGFNLRLANRLKKLGVPIIYYVSPQVWAWRPQRVRRIAELVDLMMVLFPFEVEFYRDHDVPVVHVGHPLVDEVPELPNVWDLQGMTGGPRLVLLPGSRRTEVKAILPAMLDAAERLLHSIGASSRLVRAPTISRSWLDELLARAESRVEVVEQDRFEVFADSHLGLCASGTATLELGLSGTPMLVMYRVGPITQRLGQWLVHLPYFSLVNLVLGEKVVPELVQRQVEGSYLEKSVRVLLSDRQKIDRMRTSLSCLRPTLGVAGASVRAADAVCDLLDKLSPPREGAVS